MKRAILPWAVARTTSSSPDETSTHASSSSSCDGDGPDARRADPLELLDGRLLDDALAGGHDQVAALLEVGQRDRGHGTLARLDLDALEVDDRDALGLAAGVRDGVDLGAEDAAAVGEEQRPVVGVGDEQVLDRVLLDGPWPMMPLPPRAWRR